MRLTGTVALVTGGASGLGHATALALRRAGARVVVLDLAIPPGAPDLAYVTGDVREEQDVVRALDACTAYGQLRVCVNCAGIGAPARIARRGIASPL
ncbi:MAG: SDR family NAD(P)-dependent oxidoreductase, partial [Sciscionella sp.]